MRKIRFLFLFCLIASGTIAQSWPLRHDYPLERPDGAKYQQLPDSIVQFYRPNDDPTLEEVHDREHLFRDNPKQLEIQSGEIVWLKVPLKNTETTATRYLMEIDNWWAGWPLIDVYVMAGDSLQRHIVTGNDIRPKDRPIRNNQYLCWLPFGPQEQKVLFIRLKSNEKQQREGILIRMLKEGSLREIEGVAFTDYTDQLLWKFDMPVVAAHHSLEFVIDSTQDFTFDRIRREWDQHSHFRRIKDYYPPVSNLLWARMKLINPDSVPKQYFFDTGGEEPKVEVYLPRSNGKYEKVLTGKKVPDTEKLIRHPFSFISYDMPALDTAYIYLKYHPVKPFRSFNSSVYTTGIIFMDREQVMEHSRISGLWKGFIIGILIFQLLYFVLRSLLIKERLGLYYALMVFGFLLLFIYLENFSNTFFALQLFFEYSDVILFLSLIILAIGLYAFTNRYLNLKTYMPWIYKLQTTILVLIIILQTAVFLQTSLYTYYSTSQSYLYEIPFSLYCALVFGSFLLVYLVSSLIGHFRKVPYALTYLVALSPFLLAIMLNAYRFAVIGDLLNTWWANAMYFSFIATSVLFAIMGIKRHNEIKLKEARAEGLIELNRTKTEFYSNVTHEFRTPLTVIMGLANLIKDHPREKELIQKNGQEVLNLVQQLLDISKAQSGALQLKLIDDNAILYLEYLIESFHPLAQEKNIDLNFHHDEEEIIMAFDREKMRFILNNLLTNAIKFTPNGGKIDVAAQSESNQLLLSVSDNGIGLSSSEAEKVFDRYYQVRKIDTTQIGDGIGLALVKELVELLDGTISVKSTEKLGSTFTVRLPLRLDNLKKEDDKTQLLKRDSLLPSPSENESIALVIEDNEDVLYYIEKVLTPSYKILTAGDGQAGFDIAVDVIPDIIISDIMMPKMDGYALTEKLKSDPRTDHIPIILLTAKTAQEEKIKGLSAGADAYLTKPFNEEELKVRMDNLIERRLKLQSAFAGHKPLVKEEPRQDPFMDKVLLLMEENYNDEGFGIGEFVKALPLGRMQVHRKLKALTNFSTSQFINYFRLEKAKELLENEQLNISETAYSCGFSDPGYFSKLFSKKYGMSPLEYRGEKVG